MSLDLIVTQPDSTDYPMFRSLIHRTRNIFEQVIVAMNPCHRRLNLRAFIEKEMRKDGCTFVYDVPPNNDSKPMSDWRHCSVIGALRVSKADRICFIEQDWIPSSDVIFRVLCLTPAIIAPLIGFREVERFHPGFMICNRADLDQTCLDFATYPGENPTDHFDKVSADLLKMYDPHLLHSTWFKHLGSLTNNYYFLDGEKGFETSRFIDLPAFLEYNRQCLEQHEDGRVTIATDFIPLVKKAAALEIP